MHIFLLSVALLCWVASPTVAYHAAVKVYDPAKNIERESSKFASTMASFPSSLLLLAGMGLAALAGVDMAIVLIGVTVCFFGTAYALGKGAICGRANNP